jgi:di/tricarboxylate transporter
MRKRQVLLDPRSIAAIAFAGAASGVAMLTPSREIAFVCAFLLLTIYLFAFEVVAVDVAAISVMVLLGLTSLLAPWMGLEAGLVPTAELFQGFASNAVVSIIAVMIIGAGLDRTGVMSTVAAFILRVGGTTERRVIPLISATVGFISSFMQNVGAAALFLPVVSRIAARTGLPLSRLLMPMGFCAILGGTVTMVGSSPLILLNDLILTSNQGLPADQQMTTFHLFDVTPVGVALLAAGILYFTLAGRLVLPANQPAHLEGHDAGRYLAETYGLSAVQVYELLVPAESPLAGQSIDALERGWGVRVVGVDKGDGPRFGAEGVDRTLAVGAGAVLAVLAPEARFAAFARESRVQVRPDLEVFAEALVHTRAGIAEVVVPPGSSLVDHSARDLRLRKTYGLSLLAIHRQGRAFSCETGGVRDVPLQAGDALVVHTTWADLAHLEKNRDFVVVTSEYPHEDLRPHKVPYALAFFVLTLGLVLLTDLRLSVALLTGALGMVLSGVLSIDEAYRAVSWKTVFLLASLIPLGHAVETSGTAAWVADRTLAVLGDMPGWVVQSAVAVLATVFSLVMSNVGATVLLVPLAVSIALRIGADPALFALTVAVATSNAFIIPTHQVNALIMGPAGYRVADFLRAGGLMTLIFLVVSLVMLNVAI